MRIVIPSRGRAERVLSRKLVIDPVIFVREDEFDIYRKNNDCEIVAVPGEIQNLPQKRQWIYDKYGDIFMLDDDVDCLLNHTLKRKNEIYDPAFITDLIYQSYDIAKAIGARLYGFNTNPRPLGYNDHTPIVMTGFINGCAMGLNQSEHLVFNPEIKSANDYWMSLLNAFYYRKVYKDMRFTFRQQGTFKNRGGLSNFRNRNSENQDNEILKKYFGKCIKVNQDGATHKKGAIQYYRQIRLPF